MLLRTSLALVASVSMIACGGGGHSTAPTPLPQPNPTPAPTELWSISGRVTAYGSNADASPARSLNASHSKGSGRPMVISVFSARAASG